MFKEEPLQCLCFKEPRYKGRNNAFKKGEIYNLKDQTEPLVYLGRNFSGNGYWNQFARVESPNVVWCEVLDNVMYSWEKTK